MIKHCPTFAAMSIILACFAGRPLPLPRPPPLPRPRPREFSFFFIFLTETYGCTSLTMYTSEPPFLRIRFMHSFEQTMLALVKPPWPAHLCSRPGFFLHKRQRTGEFLDSGVIGGLLF